MKKSSILIGGVALVILLGVGLILGSEKTSVPDSGQSATTTPELTDGLLTLSVGETKVARGLSITLLEVVQDYRCPVDVQCIEAGAIVAQVKLESSLGEAEMNIAQDGVPYQFGNYLIAITEVSPELVSGVEIAPEDYRVTFTVTGSADLSERTVSWGEAVEMLESGEVEMVMQTHSLEVRMTLKDGSKLVTVEPEIDAVFRAIDSCGIKCRDIIQATE